MVLTDLSWLFGLRRRGPKKMTMFLGQGYLRFSMTTFPLTSWPC